MTAIDQNGDYKIDYGEFAKVFRRASESRWLAKQVGGAVRRQIRKHKKSLTDAFRHFDTNEDGMLSRHELQRGLRKLNISLSARDMKRLMEVIDANGDGRVNWQEFLAVATRLDSSAPARPSPRPRSPARPSPRPRSARRVGPPIASRDAPSMSATERSTMATTWVGRLNRENRFYTERGRLRSPPSSDKSALSKEELSPIHHFQSPVPGRGPTILYNSSPHASRSSGPSPVSKTLEPSFTAAFGTSRSSPSPSSRVPSSPPTPSAGPSDPVPEVAPEPEPEPEGIDDDRSVYMSSFRADDDPKHLSTMVETQELERMRLDEIASEVAEMHAMVQEVRESRSAAIEGAKQRLHAGLGLMQEQPPNIQAAIVEYNEGLRLVDDKPVQEIQDQLSRLGVEWKAEYDEQRQRTGASAFGATNVGEPNSAVEGTRTWPPLRLDRYVRRGAGTSKAT